MTTGATLDEIAATLKRAGAARVVNWVVARTLPRCLISCSCTRRSRPTPATSIRLAANTGARLHLVEPLGFSMDDRQLKRAGLDYHELANVTVHRGLASLPRDARRSADVLLFDSCPAALHGRANTRRTTCSCSAPETSGLPPSVLDEFAEEMRLKLPMRPGNRSLNLSNAVAVVVFEAWRQLGFPGSG